MTSAAILAGGDARRFGGRDKTQLRLNGRTILDRQRDALRGIVDRIFLIGYRGDLAGTAEMTVVPDRIAGHGPLGGLETALAAAGTDNVLLLACDMPNLTRQLLAFLAGALKDADAVVPCSERGYHPLCAVYAQSCRMAVETRLQRGQLRMTDLLADLRLRVVDAGELAPFGDPGQLLANLNSQADLDAAESLGNH
jgi:molybdopterin-guanine dinucleotide biosynthesis protein A